MYKDLPEHVKHQVLCYLVADDFKTAKKIYDTWTSSHSPLPWTSQPTESFIKEKGS